LKTHRSCASSNTKGCATNTILVIDISKKVLLAAFSSCVQTRTGLRLFERELSNLLNPEGKDSELFSDAWSDIVDVLRSEARDHAWLKFLDARSSQHSPPSQA